MPTQKSSAQAPRVLMVDDEAAILRFLRTALDTGEFVLQQAENGHAALAAAAAARTGRQSRPWSGRSPAA